MGDEKHREEYCKKKVAEWKSEPEILAQIAWPESQASYYVYVSEYKHKFTIN